MARQAERRAATTAAITDAARALFRAHGYEAVSIDDIAAAAGCTKGAFYHHFPSKQAIFEQLVDTIQFELARGLSQRTGAASEPAEAMADSICAYLEGANHPAVQRILLVDGPVVLGWGRWREIDDAHFAGMVRAGAGRLMGQAASPAEVESATRLILGAIMEAALAASAAPDPARAVADFRGAFSRILSGLRPA